MPEWGPIKSGKEAENYWNARLVEELRGIGYPSAGFERIFRVRKAEKRVDLKPDITFTDGGVHVLSGKFGERKELEAFTSATQYKEDLSEVLKRADERLGEVFAVVYPAARAEKFHLHVLPRPGRDAVAVTVDSLEEVASEIKLAVEGLITELERRADPVLDVAKRLFRWGAEYLADALKGIELARLEAIFGGHDFFVSLLRPRLKGEVRANALRLGTAYLFVNQVLFYVLLSRAAAKAGKRSLYPPIAPKHFRSPAALRDEYFSRVRAKNYEPVYGFGVASFFEEAKAEQPSEDLVRGILGLAPRLNVPDLMGQVFQTVIPFEIRKPLGAHFTNPRAAALLARLVVREGSDHILDPACGSGTLLVAAYRRKMELSQGDMAALHNDFVTKQITGIDAMAFSAHLASVNLALQQPLLDTDHVRIATRDSTTVHPGDTLLPAAEALPHELQQAHLDREFGRPTEGKFRGTIRTSGPQARLIPMTPVDVVMMNPPFTSWDNMGKSYRENLNKRFKQEKAEYRKALFWKTSQQAHFLLLADRFLSDDRRDHDRPASIGAVLPFTTFTGRAFHPLIEFLCGHYAIEAIVVGLGRSNFSEDTSLTELLLVASRGRSDASKTRVLAVHHPPEEWTDEMVDEIAWAYETGTPVEGVVSVKDYPQTDLLPEGETLPGMFLRMDSAYDAARADLEEVLSETRIPFLPLAELRERHGIDITRWVLGTEHLGFYGASALIISREPRRALRKGDRLVFDGISKGIVFARDRIGGEVYRFPAKDIRPALRRFSLLEAPDISGRSDFVVTRVTPDVEKALRTIYGRKKANVSLTRIQERTKKFKGGRWASRVKEGSARLLVVRRIDLSAPGSSVLSTWSKEPVFLVTDGWMVKGLPSAASEKLFCLWINSTPFLLLLLGRATLNRGTWSKLEKFVLDRIPFPDPNELDAAQLDRVEMVWDSVTRTTWPSLMDQLTHDDPARLAIDDWILASMGVETKARRDRLGRSLRDGALSALRLLQGTM
ncbi:MAG: N-6 DNA methylase [Thermoplasmata archaeon]